MGSKNFSILQSRRQVVASLGEDVGNLEPHTPLMEKQNSALALETAWQVVKKLNIELLYDPVILLLAVYPGEMKMFM